MIDRELAQQLLQQARQAREKAYAPYSQFPVGAAVLTVDGHIFTGGNIENASFVATVCAERVAIFTAVAAGEPQITALAVIADTPAPVAPCGLCRQVLQEFGPDCQVIMGNLRGNSKWWVWKNYCPIPLRNEVGWGLLQWLRGKSLTRGGSETRPVWCAEPAQQLGGVSPLLNLMEVKG